MASTKAPVRSRSPGSRSTVLHRCSYVCGFRCPELAGRSSVRILTLAPAEQSAPPSPRSDPPRRWRTSRERALEMMEMEPRTSNREHSAALTLAHFASPARITTSIGTKQEHRASYWAAPSNALAQSLPYIHQAEDVS